MKSAAATWKSVVLTFVLAVVFYALAWHFMNKRQTGKGPWQVQFTTNSAGVPQLIIAQPALGISNITVQFAGEKLQATNHTGAVAFSAPKQATPFGQLLYDDLMFQPGDVAVDCFGHIVEMVPAALGLNGRRFGWTNNAVYSLGATNKLSEDARKKLKGGYRR